MKSLKFCTFLHADKEIFSFDGRPIELEIEKVEEWVLVVSFNLPKLSPQTFEKLCEFFGTQAIRRMYDIQPEEDDKENELFDTTDISVDLLITDLDNTQILTRLKDGIVRTVLTNEPDFDLLIEVPSLEE